MYYLGKVLGTDLMDGPLPHADYCCYYCCCYYYYYYCCCCYIIIIIIIVTTTTTTTIIIIILIIIIIIKSLNHCLKKNKQLKKNHVNLFTVRDNPHV